MHGFSRGGGQGWVGMSDFFRGACMVFPGGMRDFIGGCVILGGHVWFFRGWGGVCDFFGGGAFVHNFFGGGHAWSFRGGYSQ